MKKEPRPAPLDYHRPARASAEDTAAARAAYRWFAVGVWAAQTAAAVLFSYPANAFQNALAASLVAGFQSLLSWFAYGLARSCGRVPAAPFLVGLSAGAGHGILFVGFLMVLARVSDDRAASAAVLISLVLDVCVSVAAGVHLARCGLRPGVNEDVE
jgi:FtsH-binding integral membrane protein